MQARTIQYLSIALFVSLMLWGAFVTLQYLGMPLHGSVLLTKESEEMVSGVCGETPGTPSAMHLLCRGAVSLVPFVIHTLGRAAPFLTYAILSLVLFLGFLGFRLLRKSDWNLPRTRKPWHVFVVAILFLWLLFTTLSFGSDAQGRPVRTYIEPTAQTYNVKENALQTLQEDFSELTARDCLTQLGETQGGAGVYTLRASCVQSSFLTRVLPQVLFVALLLFELLALGRLILRAVRLRPKRLLSEAILSIALGACGWIALLWLAASFGIFNATVGWILVLAVPLICYSHSMYWLRCFVAHEWESDWQWNDVRVILGWLLLSYIALNFLSVVRPFPIGWDDLGSYLNRPRMLVSYGHFIFSMSPFDWSYLTAAGFLLFGYDTIAGATTSMMVNWTAGLLAVFAVYTVANLYIGRRHGLLAALLYYSLPLVGHFSFADMKIDNAVFFLGAMATFALMLALFPAESDHDADGSQPADVTDASHGKQSGDWWKYIFIAGVFAGFTFSTKATGVMVTMALAAMLAGAMLHWVAGIGAVSVSAIVFSYMGGLNVAAIFARAMGGTPEMYAPVNTVFMILCILLAALCFGYAIYQHQKAFLPFVIAGAVFCAGFAAAVVPWIEHNNLVAGNIIPRLMLGAPNRISPSIDLRGTSDAYNVHRLSADLQPNMENPACTPTGSKEELDRYWGDAKGWGHYLSLPWRTVMNLDSAGYYVTTIPALLLFPLLLLLPYVWTKRGRWLRWTAFSVFFLLLQWMLLANGIPWYGIAIFLGLMVGLEAMIAKAPDNLSRSAAWVLVILSLFVAFAMRFWQFEQQRNILEYGFGKISGAALEEVTIPYYSGISADLMQRHEAFKKTDPPRPLLYRVGTFIPYFIPRNLEVIGINDHQLDVFNCLYQERDAKLTLRRLQALGFNSIIFDTNTSTIEQDQQGSLHKKVELFQQFVNTPGLGVQVLVNDLGAGVAYITLP